MIAKIYIDCDDGDEIIAHLKEIIRQISKERKKLPDGEITKKIVLTDNNCYGVHNITIKP